MPRLDTSCDKNLAVLKRWGIALWQHVSYRSLKVCVGTDWVMRGGEVFPRSVHMPVLPSPPIADVCNICYEMHFVHWSSSLERVPYEGQDYRCTICQHILTEEDDHAQT